MRPMNVQDKFKVEMMFPWAWAVDWTWGGEKEKWRNWNEGSMVILAGKGASLTLFELIWEWKKIWKRSLSMGAFQNQTEE